MVNEFEGMDAAGVRALAAKVRAQGQAMRSAVGRLDGVVAGMRGWRGPDSEQFRGVWRVSHRPRMVALQDELERLASTLMRNAEEQEKTSSAEAALPAGTSFGATISLSDDANLSGSLVFAREYEARPGVRRGGKYGFDRDLVDLAQASYHDTEDHLPEGWKRVSDDDIRALGLDPNDFGGKEGDSFRAKLFVDGDGNYVLGFEGTNPGDPQDWKNDIAGGIGLPVRDLGRAGELGQSVKHATQNGKGKSLTFTGHSWGGEQAAFASLATGEKAVTFNAAGLHDENAKLANQMYTDRYRSVNHVDDARERVTNYRSQFDVLSNNQGMFPSQEFVHVPALDPWDPASFISAGVPYLPTLLGRDAAEHPSHTVSVAPEAYGRNIDVVVPAGELSPEQREAMYGPMTRYVAGGPASWLDPIAAAEGMEGWATGSVSVLGEQLVYHHNLIPMAQGIDMMAMREQEAYHEQPWSRLASKI